MRVLQLHTRYRQRGGEDEVVDAEARVLKEAGHQVHQLIERNPQSNIRAAGSLTLSPWNPLAMRRVKEAIADFRPEVAHVHNTWFAMSPVAIRVLKKAGVPVVMTLHNYRLTCANGLLFRDGAPCELCIDSHPWHAVRYGCYRDSRAESLPAAATIDFHRRLGTWAKQVDVFIVLTSFQRNLMILAGLPREKVVVKPHFVTDPGPRPAPPSASNLVLYVGRLSEEKGVHVLLEAWRRAALQGLELVIVGDGPDRRFLEGNRPPGTRLIGSVPPAKVRKVMLSARALVMPSLWYETMGMVMLEAFAAGMPVAVSDGGPPAEIVGAALGQPWVFRSADPASLRETLEQIEDDSLCDTSGDLARRTFEADFVDSRAADRLLGIYQTLPGQRGQEGS